MWTEPLTASAERIDTHTFAVTTRDGAGLAVATVRCTFNQRAGFGRFGAMRLLDDNGGPRQRLRALVLLVREAIRFGDAIGITRVNAEAPERMTAFVAHLSGIEGALVSDRRLFELDLHAARTATLRASSADGALRDLTPEEEEALDAAIDLRR